MKAKRSKPAAFRTTRRAFVRTLTGALTAPLALANLVNGDSPTTALKFLAQASTGPGRPPGSQTNSDVGSLYPFIQSQAVQSDFPLSFLNARFKNLRRWKRQARGKL